MRRNNSLRISVLALLIIGSFLVLHSAGYSLNSTECNTTRQISCKCKKQQDSSHQDGMIWETISRQFFS